jgi:hypothetical protein
MTTYQLEITQNALKFGLTVFMGTRAPCSRCGISTSVGGTVGGETRHLDALVLISAKDSSDSSDVSRLWTHWSRVPVLPWLEFATTNATLPPSSD